ncbi:MAG: nitrite reductase large subunit NirB [Pseudomonadota bacterium]
MSAGRVRAKTRQGESVVVVGNGMVGHHFVTKLREREPGVSITVIGAEETPAYDRVHLSDLFADKTPADLALATTAQYAAMDVTLRLGERVESVDSIAKTLSTSLGATLEYDRLVVATGSYPFVPPIPGREDSRCLEYRTVADLDAIRACARSAKRGVVIGGGLLGLECANALKNLGLETHIVEFAPGLMGVQLDGAGSDCLRAKIEALGVSVHTEKSTEGIEAAADHLVMRFADGSTLATEMIVFSAGIRPHDELARAAGLVVGERGGIVVDRHCQTSEPSIFAIGECALYDGRIFGLVAPGYRMAEAAVAALAGELAGELPGEKGGFTGADMSTKLKLLGVDVGSIGDAHGQVAGTLSYVFSDPLKGVYKRLNLSPDGERVSGAVLVGDCSEYDRILQYALNDLPVPDEPESLFLPAHDAEAAGLTAAALPSTATICSCHNVTKGALCDAVAGGVTSMSGVKEQTQASTGCGGCAALCKSILDEELATLGIAVDRSICAHFPFTRQELFHICQVEQITTFDALLARHGTGLGCDVCKPAVASILASLWNDYVLAPQHESLQDTNDRFLANMQKNGTYSVVPRVPGGEITPAKLIAIGEVARDFDLYTKITGGQRIDLFGAELHELPLIWKRLIDAGFETGHAYGKALRTVKSCVGSSWCRYGVQDSVAMALYVENRYKGLRSPHKLKMAVSGCTRECAEAQSKDVGVIATENGWNLFVCGNGGMRPRHADLFATDLDDDTLIRYIDRLLMFYVRTADRLQRTSVWLENLPGGLDYLRAVVIDDSLGVAASLEEQMANIVGTYQCEWKTTVEDPARLQRFRQYINSGERDDNVVFVRERGQRRPATRTEIDAIKGASEPVRILSPSETSEASA